ncbi:MAG: UvrD-helicase domain-containing protein, partial [Dorea sp.]|nr:UvrD-helicase domain-containing protein [Dorea sp.]
MGVSWTKEQEKVIELRDRNILVSAAAGSGKTAVLVQRIITMLTDSAHPMDVDQLLVVTFTEAAAAEMKERVRAAIEKELELHPEDEHLLRQATLIHNAQITTIHSFCLSVIRDHFHAIDLDPGFRIAEEGELKLLEKDVVSELLESRYAEGSERFTDFSLAYAGGRSDKSMEDLIVRIYKYSRSYPDPQSWLLDCQALYEISSEEELEKSAMMERTKKQVSALLRDAVKLNQKALSLALSENGPYMYEQNLVSDREILDRLMEEKTYCGLQKAVAAIKFSTLSRKKDATVDPSKQDAVKKLRDQVKEIVKKVSEKYLSDPVEGILKDLVLCREPLKELISLVEAFAERFEETKRKQNMIDFSDMEQYAMRILNEKKEDGSFVPSPAAKEYQDHYKEIMIDEYQDSNLIQETILTSIATIHRGRYNIFMVGDVKQSIYRFRLSRPELFMEKFDSYSTEDSLTQRIDLHKNFRSRAEVLYSVNKIFE